MVRRLNLYALILLAFLPAGSAFAQNTVTLAWDANAAADNVTGYTVYYGTATGAYTASTQVGNVTQWTTPTLASGTYYFAVTATSAIGESGKSAEVSTPVPVPQSACTPPLGANAISIFITKIHGTSGSIGSQIGLDYQIGSPGSPIVSVDTLINGTKTDPTQSGTVIGRFGSIWFTSPTTAGTYSVAISATNAAGCTTIGTKDALGNLAQFTVK
jgi:hypothetical protein